PYGSLVYKRDTEKRGKIAHLFFSGGPCRPDAELLEVGPEPAGGGVELAQALQGGSGAAAGGFGLEPLQIHLLPETAPELEGGDGIERRLLLPPGGEQLEEDLLRAEDLDVPRAI